MGLICSNVTLAIQTGARNVRLKARRVLFLALCLPFLQPRAAVVLYATCSGVLLSFATESLLGLLTPPVTKWTWSHVSGVLFLLAALGMAGLTTQAQAFLDHLIVLGKDRHSPREKVVQFRSWPDRRQAWLVLTLSLLFTALALVWPFTSLSSP